MWGAAVCRVPVQNRMKMQIHRHEQGFEKLIYILSNDQLIEINGVIVEHQNKEEFQVTLSILKQ